MTEKLKPPFWEFNPEGGLSLGTLKALSDYSKKLKNQKHDDFIPIGPMKIIPVEAKNKINAYMIPGMIENNNE